jgi:hypothetical protein
VCCRWAASAKIKHLTSNCSRRLRLSTDFLPVYRDPQIIATLSLSGCVCFERQLVMEQFGYQKCVGALSWLLGHRSFVCLVGRGDDNEGAMVDCFFPCFECVLLPRSFYAPGCSTAHRKKILFCELYCSRERGSYEETLFSLPIKS